MQPVDTSTKVGQILEWRRIRSSFPYFAANYWNIPRREIDFSAELDDFDDPWAEEESRSFGLWPYQADLAASLLTEPRIFILKARQIGVTTMIAAYCVWRCITKPGTLVIFVSKTEDDAKAVITQMRMFGLSRFPEWLTDRIPVTDRSVYKVTWGNNSMFEAGSASAHPARGRTATVVVLDEWAYAKQPMDAWTAAEPAAESGQLISMSTAFGEGTFFHQQWLEANSDDSPLHPIFLPWNARPDRGAQFLADKARTIRDPELLAREYPDTPEDAFRTSTVSVFAASRFEHMTPSEPERGVLRIEQRTGPRFVPYTPGVQDDDRLAIWGLPQAGRLYFVGVDVAGSQRAGDYSSVHVVADTGNVVAHWHGWIEGKQLAAVAALLGYWFNNALVVVERAGGWGEAVCQELVDAEYPNVFHQNSRLQGLTTFASKPGFAVTPQSKKLLVETLAQLLFAGRLAIECADTIDELILYQVLNEATGKMGAPAGKHDDRVVSLMLAAYALDRAGDLDNASPTVEITEMAPGWRSLDFWVQLAAERAEQTGRSRMEPLGDTAVESLSYFRASWRHSSSDATTADIYSTGHSRSRRKKELPIAHHARQRGQRV